MTSRLSKYPEKLPRIDWEDYRTNVRLEAIKMVDEFEKKYEELNKVFDDRVKLDTKKYYAELEKQRAEVQVQVKQYIDESNQRIKAYEAEIARICGMKPYSSMTIEEFINLRPEHSTYIPHSRKPLFWPHDLDEQIPGPVGIKKPGEGGSGGAGDGSHPIKPNDFKGKTEKFEFNAGKIDEARPSVEAKAAEAVTAPALAMATEPTEAKPAPPQQVDAVETVKETIQKISSEREKPHLAETKPCVNQVELPKSSAEKVVEPKIHIDTPISEELRRKLDPCNLIEEHHKKEEAAADRCTTPASSKPEEKTQPIEKLEKKSRGEKSEQLRKPHPCDLVKMTKEPTAEKVDACKTILKRPDENEKKDSRVFLNPCEVTFGSNARVSLPGHTTQKENAVVKSEKTKAPKEPTKELKKPLAGPKEAGLHLKKKVETCAHGESVMGDEDSCKSATSKDSGLHIEKKVETCARGDSCKSGSSVEVKPIQTKTLDSKTAKTKSEPNPSTTCDSVKKTTVVDKDISKSVASKERGLHIEKNVETCARVEPMVVDKNSSKSAASKERGLHIEKNVETCGTSVEMKPILTKTLDSKTAKPKSEPKTFSSCQPVAPKEIKSQSCVMDHSTADASATMSTSQKGGSCAPTPYYNPFRSDEENRQKEEEAWDECNDEDPCTDDKRRPKTAYYNPFKDDKKKK
ncbi:translation initiation factor IF-2 isoform X2 [Anastrepha obliqua]|uniref:translation initiation factor IF-2 isoform X2 n=1 Tax=Anastrepha obliqua TaxID=95512 RepID=UPI00240907F4|nr:translation initiation factor IF-2 isoform X2 [Anastrepha obliqua]